MKGVISRGFLVLFLLCISTWSAAQSEGILTKNVNLRASPSVSSQRIMTLPRGTRVSMVDPQPMRGYYHIRTAQKLEGWVWAKSVQAAPSRTLVRRPASLELEPQKPGMASAACAPDLASCPSAGCAAANSPHGLLNQLKRTVPTSTNATVLSFDDFASLQQQADGLVGEDRELTADDRAKLKGLAVANGTVSEGDLVSIIGYLVGTPHPNTKESVNCNLRGESNNDYHIPLSFDPTNNDFRGIIVEMIPQGRPEIWNLANLTQVGNNHQLVMVAGALFYDNMHFVNGDPNNPKGGQPRRFSLWEVHPITGFVVCTKLDNSCDPSQPSDWASIGGGQ